MSETSEIRDGIPMVTRLKYTIRPASRFDPIRDLGDGRIEGVMNQDTPGMLFGITPFVCNRVHKETFFEFKERAFWQAQLDHMQAAQKAAAQKAAATPDAQMAMAIDRVTLMLSEHPYWLEDLFEEAGVTDLAGSWAQAFSDSLDEFTAYREPDQRIGGLPFSVKQIRWDAKLPYLQPKQVEVTIGIYEDPELNDVPVEDKLLFEDGVSLRARQERIAGVTKRIADLETSIVAMERITTLLAMPQSTAVLDVLATFNPDLVKHKDLPSVLASQHSAVDGATRELAELNAAQFGVLSKLFEHKSVTSTMKQLCMSAFRIRKKMDPRWAGLNVELMDQLFAIPDVS